MTSVADENIDKQIVDIFRHCLIHAGVLLIRLAGLMPDEKAVLVQAAIERHGEGLSSGFAVLSERSFRLRKNIR